MDFSGRHVIGKGKSYHSMKNVGWLEQVVVESGLGAPEFVGEESRSGREKRRRWEGKKRKRKKRKEEKRKGKGKEEKEKNFRFWFEFSKTRFYISLNFSE